MSNLTPALLPLDKGLNLQDAKITAPVGSVLDTLNYEQVDFKGQKRIDGYSRYDGHFLASIDDYYKIVVTPDDVSFPPLTNDLLFDNSKVLFGIVCLVVDNGDGTFTLYVAPINSNCNPARQGDMSTWRQVGGSVVTATHTIISAQTGLESAVDYNDHYSTLTGIVLAGLRTLVAPLPGACAGLYWFRDRLYAVADVTRIYLGTLAAPIHPNDTVALDDGTKAKVLDIFPLTLEGLDTVYVIFIDALDPTPWYQSSININKVNADLSTTLAGVTDPDGACPLPLQIASFFETRSEQQVLDEDGPNGPYTFGWKFVDQGWILPFTDGNTLYGSLPSINQNIQGLGIQGPTDISGTNGRPLLLSQKIAITNKTTQVNGWKDSGTPTSYELNATNVSDDDSDYVYADAFISWDGITGAVIAPGLTDSNLIEYPATNTVDIA